MLKQILVPVISGLLLSLIGEWILRRTAEDGRPLVNQRRLNVALGVILAAALFLAMRNVKFAWAAPDDPILQSIEANPNSVKKGEDVTVVVRIDRPAPKHGISVSLSCSDQSILTTNGNAFIEPGQVIGNGYFKAVSVPNYRSPIRIVATYNDDQVSTQVSFATVSPPEPVRRDDPASRRSVAPLLAARNANHLQGSQPAVMEEQPTRAAAIALDPELVSRLEESQGRFVAEKSYWDNVKEHMAPGSSIRPEITSQIYAAQSTSGRCAREEQAKDAAALSSCVEALNDHLNQLKLQH